MFDQQHVLLMIYINEGGFWSSRTFSHSIKHALEAAEAKSQLVGKESTVTEADPARLMGSHGNEVFPRHFPELNSSLQSLKVSWLWEDCCTCCTSTWGIWADEPFLLFLPSDF